MRYFFLFLIIFFNHISFSQIGDCNNGGAKIGGPFTHQVDLISKMVDVATKKLTTVGQEDFGSGITNTSKDLYYKISGGTKGAISFMLYSASLPDNCLTYKAELYDVGNCTAVVATSDIGIYHSNNAKNFVFNNISNKDYILKLTLTVSSACNLQSINLGYFPINPPVSCIACANSCSETLSYTSQNSDLTTAFNDLETKISSNIGSFYNIPIKKGETKTTCVNVKIPQNTKTIGFRQNFTSLDGNSCGTPKFTYKLYDKNCSNTTLTPARTNANNFGSGFNPEYDNPPAGEYRMCLTIENNTASCEVVGLNYIGIYMEAPTACNASVGTLETTKLTGSNNEYTVKAGDTWSLSHKDFILPPAGNGGSFMGYLVYTCKPPTTIDVENPSNGVPAGCFKGVSHTATDQNVAGVSKVFAGITEIWVVPVTLDTDESLADDDGDGVADKKDRIDENKDGCYAIADAIHIIYAPALPCGTCATPDCPIGRIPRYLDRFPAGPGCIPSVNTNCPGQGAQDCTSGILIKGPETSYHTVTADAFGNLGAFVQLVSSLNSQPFTISSELYEMNDCNGTPKVKGKFSTDGLATGSSSNVHNRGTGNGSWNPEWKGLVPGKSYILKTIFTPGSGDEITGYCMDYYGSTSCAAKIGSTAVKINGSTPASSKNPSTDYYLLCKNDVIEFNTTGYTLPPKGAGGQSGIGYTPYTCVPTSGTEPKNDACWGNVYDINNPSTDINDGSIIAQLPSASNQTYYFVPVTMDEALSNSMDYDQNGDKCYQMGTPIKVTYLNDITFTNIDDCTNSRVEITLNGGKPEFVSGSSYTITNNTTKGILSASTLSTSGGKIYLTGLTKNDAYDLTVDDGTGCTKRITGTYNCTSCTPPIVTGLTTICQGTTVEWTSTAPLTSSDNTNYFATITPSGTVNKYNVTASNPTTTPTSLKFTATLAGCSVEKEITIIKKPDITGIKSFCEEGNTTLACLNPPATATAAWSLTTASSIATVDNTGKVTGLAGQSGNVDITYTDDKGCTNSVTVTVNPNLVPTITCGTSTATSVTFTWGSVSGATSYDLVYNKDNTGNQTVSGHTTTSYPVSSVPSGKSVTLIVTPKGTGCFKASAVKSCTADNCPSPTITKDPDNVAKCAGANTSFSVTATSTATLTYQWQINNGANPPTNLTNTGVYTGTTDPTLVISNVTGLDGVKYQCLVTETSSGTGCNKTSLPATLTVNPIPAFTPTVSDICEGSDPSIAYTGLTGNPDRIVFDPGLPLITPFNLSISPSPITVTGLPIKLPVNTYSGVKVRVENTTTGCKSADITITPFKVQATQKPSISSKSTTVNSVTFQWSNLTGLNTQTGGEDKFTVKEFICSGCATAGTYVNATGNLTYNATSSKWEYEKTGLSSGDKVYIEVTPFDNTPLATPSCYGTSSFELLAIPCVSPIITQDIIDVSLCEGTTTTPVSSSFELKYNTAASTSPATWEMLSPGGSWTTLNASGVYSITGSDNVDTKLTISDIKGLDGTKYRVNLKTATTSGSCNTISHESILTVKPLPLMNSISDKSFCPGTLVNDPSKPLDFEFKVSQAGTPTFTWNSDVQTTGVSTGGTDVTSFASFTTLSPLNDEVSKITVTPKLNLCVGQPITFNITVKPTVKPVFTNSVIDFKSVQFNWASSSVAPDFWVIDTLITSSTAATPSLTNYKSGGQQLGTVNTYSIGGINSTKKAYISITPKQDPSKTTLFCPVVDGLNEIPTPCVKPTKPANPTVNPLCEGAALTVNGVLPDATANFQWKISSDAGITWNNVSFSDFGNTGTTNILSTQLTKAYMNNALVKVVLTDKITGLCTEESNTATIIINELPNVKLIQPTSTSLCVDDNDVSAFVQLVSGKSPLKIDYTLNGVQSKDQDIANLEIKFTTKNEMNYSLTLDKVTDANGCIFPLTGLSSQVSIHKNPSPKFVVSDTIGCYPLLINFTDISGEKYKEVTWDFGTGINSSKELGTTQFTYPKEGDYTVTYSVLNEFGCSGQIIKPDQIHVKSTPKAAITTDRNILSVYENVVKFDSKLSKNVSFYLWDFGDNSPISNDPVVEHKYDPSVPGKFKISLIVSNSSTNMTCSDTAVTWIDFPEEVVFFIPNTFTPNGDEFNNTFQPIFTSGYDPQNYSFIIFDRWGQVVFESNNPQVGWDGTHGDKILGNDTFVWKLGFKEKSSDNEHRSTGHVNLVK